MTGATGAATSSSSGAVTVAAVRAPAKGGVRLVVRASDKNSGIGKVQVKSSLKGKVADVSTSSPKATSRTVRVNTTKKKLWVRVVDRAGNASKWVTVTVK
jgi:ABC-type molybdate transport system ATPase subunit